MTTEFMANCCRCGHIFTADSGPDTRAGMASQEEAYEAYLAARLDQARIAAERAIKVLSKDPVDKHKIANADRANRELEEINNEYAAQLAVVEKAYTEARGARSSADKFQPRPVKPTTQVDRQSPLSAPKMVSLSSSTVSAARARDAQKQRAVVAPVSRAVTSARSGRLRQDASAAILARRAAQQLIAQRAEALAARRPGKNAMPEKMRESERDKAEKAVQQSRRSSSSSISGNLAAAAQALDSKVNSKPMSRSVMECPNCTTRLPVTAEKCGCGYQFQSGTDSMPGLSLDTKDLQDLF